MKARFAMLTGCLGNYRDLAAITIDRNKADYCNLYGYELVQCREITKPFQNGASHAQGYSWSRLAMMHRLVASRAYEWVYCVGCDTMITNYAIGLSDLVAYAGTPRPALPKLDRDLPPGVPGRIIHKWPPPDYRADGRTHVIFAADRGSVVQADSFFVRCSPQGEGYLADILDKYSVYQTQPWVEQQAMMDLKDKHAAITRIVPQHIMNSYDYRLFFDRGSYYHGGHDCYGERGQWLPGDFLIHWPSTPLAKRIELAHEYDKEVIQ